MPRKRNSTAQRSNRPRGGTPAPSLGLRIIGGRLRGRKLLYGGDRRVRPMKDRVREAIFNLVGPAVKGKHAVDLFAGTGALGLEALSRGAARATLIEQHFPSAEIIRQNVAALGLTDLVQIATGDVFIWQKRCPELSPTAWLVFCSPPYDLYVERTDAMLELIDGLMRSAPAESIFVVESDERFDFGLLPDAPAWDVRPYPPAVVGVYRHAATSPG